MLNSGAPAKHIKEALFRQWAYAVVDDLTI